ncbi:MAG: hypothetical protein CVU39_04840 [Chloroflexi bacterium HGW-Chloroflexi-10]|nr:MAG: hypothetical protein CVU39_04840 [Chloroflexi bacterium HGW-Chloroflexi-10]
MTTGMLWYDDDPKRKLNDKIQLASNYYQEKYGSQPTLCFVHPKLKESSEDNSPGLEIQYNFAVAPNHIWVGVK